MNHALINLCYLAASVLFIFGLKGLTHPRTAVRGNILGSLGMLLAVVATFFYRDAFGHSPLEAIGLVMAAVLALTAVGPIVAEDPPLHAVRRPPRATVDADPVVVPEKERLRDHLE